MESFAIQIRAWKPDDRRVARLRQAVQCRATRVGQPEHLGTFIKGFPRGIIKSPAQQFILSTFADEVHVRMSPGNH